MTTSRLLERARQNGHPLIDDNTVTFLWEGETAPRIVSDLTQWDESPLPMTPIAPGLWACSFDLPPDAYLEYSFYDPDSRERIPDPLNPHKYWNGIHAYNNYFHMPGSRPSPLARRRPEVPRGTVTRHQVESGMRIIGSHRDVYLYQPPMEVPAPLLVVYDGPDYLRRGKLVTIVDNLIAQKRIRPLAMALVQNAGADRHVEYSCADSTLAFLTDRLIPLAKAHLALLDADTYPGAHGIMGASMGGLMALYTSLRMPQVFGKALCQAGAYRFWGQEGAVFPLVRHLPASEVELWLDCGRMDFLLEANRQMAGLLEEKGYNFRYCENGGAHNYATWRDACAEGLEFLFGKLSYS
jgi:enterochelin esterase family protein